MFPREGEGGACAAGCVTMTRGDCRLDGVDTGTPEFTLSLPTPFSRDEDEEEVSAVEVGVSTVSTLSLDSLVLSLLLRDFNSFLEDCDCGGGGGGGSGKLRRVVVPISWGCKGMGCNDD